MMPRKGKRLTKTGKYTIAPKKGRGRTFVGTLLKTINFGAKRLALFSVPKVRRKTRRAKSR